MTKKAFGVLNPGDSEPPSTPANLVATTVSATEIDLVWDASTDNVQVVEYQVWRDDTPLDLHVVTASFSDSGLSPSTAYTYKVAAVDAAGNNSGFSNEDTATTGPNAAPVWSIGRQDLEVGVAYFLDLNTVCADADGDALAYTVVAGPLPSGVMLSGSVLQGTPDTVESQNVTLGADDGIAARQDATVVFDVTQADTTPPSVPTGLTSVDVGESFVALDWDDNAETDFASYNLYRDGGLRQSGILLSQYTDTGLSAGTSYSYSVSAVDSSGNESAQSASHPITTDPFGSVSYPLTMNVSISAPHTHLDPTWLDRYEKFDAIINGAWEAWNIDGTMAQWVTELKTRKPTIKLYGNTSVTNYNDSAGTGHPTVKAKLEAETGPGGTDWFAYQTDGVTRVLHQSTQNKKTNFTTLVTPDGSGDRVPQAIARIQSNYMGNTWGLDGVFIDNMRNRGGDAGAGSGGGNGDLDYNQDGTADTTAVINQYNIDANAAFVQAFQSFWPNAQLFGNGTSWALDSQPSPPEYNQVGVGFLIEKQCGESWSWSGLDEFGARDGAFGDGRRSLEGWTTATTFSSGTPIFQCKIAEGGAQEYKLLRYMLGLCLMRDGYFAADDGFNAAKWYDEYDKGGSATTGWLGEPIDAPRGVNDFTWGSGPVNVVWSREFQNGWVAVNGSQNAINITIPAGFKAFTGTQDPVRNNGLPISGTYSLPGEDAIILERV